ncbi:MAG: SARP family transcriptional regulator, partial [Lachnospiraceae bacterium]|nr:SARP family transcriptional regulator [Lachnospiraceae bacterium]
QQKKTGAFYCEYEFFKDIYRLEARSAERTGNSIYLCLMTITTPSGNQPPLNNLNKAMDKLKTCIFNSLRSSDIFSRYSVSQYILMLPTTSYESGERVLKRIAGEFQKANSNDRIILQYKLQPLEPVSKND